MSTYTDLHNRVKENITVDYNNRITTQRVRLFNEQNEFWGTLRGHISAENINIEGGSLSGVTLTDTILKGSVALPDGIDLKKIMQQVADISALTLENDANIKQEIRDRENAVEAEKDARVYDMQEEIAARTLKDAGLSSAVDLTNTDMKREISTLNIVLTHQDADISAELDRRIKTVDYKLDQEIVERKAEDICLSDAIVESRADFGREVFDRKMADEKLAAEIAAQAVRSERRDSDLSAALEEHIADNEEQFANLCVNTMTAIEHERHYTIYKGPQDAKTTDSWPYSCKDYAVNIYNPALNDGAVFYCDDESKTYRIGTIHKLETSSLYPFNFKTLKGISHPAVASALLDNSIYSFTDTQKDQETKSNGYRILFNDEHSSGELSNFTFSLYPTLPQYHKMTHGGTMVGKVTEAYPVNYTENIISGKIWFDTTDTQLETFNKFRNRIFNNTNLSVHNILTERVTYLGDNKFKCEKNIDRATFIGLYDSKHPAHYEFGRIYDRYDNVSGIISDEVGIEEVNVRLNSPYNSLQRLCRENGFNKVVSSDIKIGDISYNDVISADIDGLSGIFDFVRVSELYKYEFTAIDADGKPYVGGYVVPKIYNKTIKQTLDFAEVSADITNVMWIDAFKKTYALTKTPTQIVWTVEDIDDDNNVLNITFNGKTLYVKVTHADTGKILYSELPVDIDNPIIYNTDTCHDHLYTTELVDLSKYKEVYESPEATYDIIVESEVKSDTLPRYELNIDTANTGVMKILVPERTSTDISREFMVVINPNCAVNKLVQLIFVDKDGNVVKISSNRRNMILVPTNKWTTLQVKEIDNNIFFVKDLDDNEDDHDIAFLSAAIDAEEAARIANDNYLSDELNISAKSLQDQVDYVSCEVSCNDNDILFLSNEISTIEFILLSGFNFLSSNIDYVSSEVSANDVDISTLSDKVEFLLSVDKETMNYKGTLPWLSNITIAGVVQDYNYLSTFIALNIGINAQGRLKKGDFFRLSAVQSCLIDGNLNKCWFGAKDYFVFNKDTIISNVIESDFDTFRNAETEFGWLSAALCAEIDDLSASLCSTVELSVKNLQDQITANDADIKFLSDETDRLSDEVSANIDSLSTRLSTDIDALSVSLSTTTKLSVEELQRQVISNDNDITYVSAQVDFLLSVGQDSMEYKGTVPYYKPTGTLTADYHLSAFLKPMVKDPEGFIKKGFMYRLSAILSTLSDDTGYTTYLGDKDFFVINKDITLDTIKFADIDIFRNSEAEVEWLSAALCAEINNLSTSLSDTTRLSIENLQDQVIANDKDISFLSTEIDRLSTELSNDVDSICASLSITTKLSVEELQNLILSNDADIKYISAEHDWLSAELSTTLDLSVADLQDQIIKNDNDIAYISAEVSCNDNDIEFLSNDLSTLEYQHYNKTLSNDISVDHTYEDREGHTHVITEVVDQLVILDEVTFDRYRLTIREGRLNINKIDNKVPTTR